MIKIDIQHGFFQIPICARHQQFYGIYHRQRRFAWTRLPMGHALAPSIMQRLAVAVGWFLHGLCGVSMVAYLDDWLIFSHKPFDPAPILEAVQGLGFIVNIKKSVLQPVTVMTYLGLHIDTVTRLLTSNTRRRLLWQWTPGMCITRWRGVRALPFAPLQYCKHCM
jgi:hypothetical protein